MTQLSETYNVAVCNPEVLADWDYELNDKKPEEYTSGSNYPAHWKCSTCAHSWTSKIKNRTKKKPNGCPACAGQIATLTRNLAICNPEVLNEWDYELNDKNPEEYTSGTNYPAHWKCSTCDHSWEVKICDRTKKNPHGCPACAGKTVTPTRNLAVCNPEVLVDWNYELNDKKPEEYTSGSNYPVHWKCSTCDHSWTSKIKNRTKKNANSCPECIKKFNQTEDSFRSEIERLTGLDFMNERIPLARKRSNYAQVDMINHALKLIIEYDGSYWHSKKADMDTHTTESMIQAGYRVIRIREQSHNYSLPFLHVDEALSSDLYQITYTCFGKNADTIEDICQKIITDKMEWFVQDSSLLKSHE